MDLKKLKIKEAQRLMEAGELSSEKLTQACLAQIEKLEGSLKSIISLWKEEALVSAQEADRRRAGGERGSLLGIPCLIKDNIMTAGHKTTAGSRFLENYISPYDATAVQKLKEAGAVILGKTNLDEFAHGSSTENSAFMITRNPYDLQRVPGGSSGGSAAALASGFCLFSLGSETGGSVRQPAAFCGLTGFKPSYGGVSRHGLIAMTSSNDVIGILAKDALDAQEVFEVLTGRDEKDSTSINIEKKAQIDLTKIKIGLPQEYFSEKLNPEIKEKIFSLVEELRSWGVEIKNVQLPSTKYVTAVYYVITPAEISSNLARLDGLRYGFRSQKENSWSDFFRFNRGEALGPEAKRRIMLGTYVLSAGYFDAYYKKAEEVRSLIKEDFKEVFAEVDFLLTPTTPHPAFKIGEKKDPLSLYLEDIFLSAASLAGIPAISLPLGLEKGLPLAFQLIASQGDDYRLLELSQSLQSKTSYHQIYPQLI